MAGQYDLNLSNGNIFTTLYPLETNGPDNISTPRLIQRARPQFNIVVATPGTNTFSVAGDVTNIFRVNFIFQVVGSTANDGQYTVQSVLFSGGNTLITTVENFTDGTSTGSLVAHIFTLVDDLTYRFVSGLVFTVKGTFTPDIIGVNTTSKEFTVGVDYTPYYTSGISFVISGSTGNDGTYVVSSSLFNGTDTVITVVGVIPSAVIDGTLSGIMDKTYTVDNINSTFDGTYTIIPVGNGNIRDNGLLPIGLPYGDITYTILDTVSSLQLPGKGVLNYGEHLIENLIRITEHFAADTPPELNVIIGVSPTATPLVGQLWYDTTVGNEGFNVYDGTGWTPNNDINGGSLIFKDTESASGNADIYITGSETNLPAPWPGTTNNQPGLVVWTQTDQLDGDAIFRVLSSNGQERLRVEHSTAANTGFTSTTNNLLSTSLGNSQFYGKLGIGNDGAPTITQTLTVEGDGIGINADAGLDAQLIINAPSTKTSLINFQLLGALAASILVDSTIVGDPLLINSNVANNVIFVTGGGKIGINQATPSATLDVVGNTELTGDLTVNTSGLLVDTTNSWVGVNTLIGSADFTASLEVTGDIRVNSQIKGSNQTAAAPTYTFTSNQTTGIYSGGVNILSFATNGTLALSIVSTGALQVPAGYETNVLTDNIITNKKYVDDSIANTSWREPVRVVDTTTYANSAAFPTTGIIDGITLVNGDRVLFINVTTTADRDVFIWNSTATSWTIDPLNTRTIGDAVYIQTGTERTKVMAFDDINEWTLVGTGSGINVRYETQTATAAQTVFTLNNVVYSPNNNRLFIYVNGVKQIINLTYTETNPKIVTFIAPSVFVGGEIVEFIAFDELISTGVAKREQQAGLDTTTQPLITFISLTYQVNSDNLLVFVNGQKVIKGIDYTETNNSSITWTGTPVVITDVLEFYASVPIVAGTKMEDIDNVASGSAITGDSLIYNGTNGLWEPTPKIPTGSIFDYITGATGTVIATTNVATAAKTSTTSHIQVFLNGILQREDLVGFAASGKYYVSGTSQLTMAVALIATDELLVYTL